MSTYTGSFAGYPIAFTNADLSFLSESSHFVSTTNSLAKATYLRVRLYFDKGGTRNLQERAFHRFQADRSSFCPLFAALHATDRWTSCDLNILTHIFCYWKMKSVTFIHDYVVTKNLRDSTPQVYANTHHLYHLHLKDDRAHSVQVIACLFLVVSKLSNATIEHRLRWALYECKVYIRESLSRVSQASTYSFYTAIGTRTENYDADYTPQEYDGDNIL